MFLQQKTIATDDLQNTGSRRKFRVEFKTLSVVKDFPGLENPINIKDFHGLVRNLDKAVKNEELMSNTTTVEDNRRNKTDD